MQFASIEKCSGEEKKINKENRKETSNWFLSTTVFETHFKSNT